MNIMPVLHRIPELYCPNASFFLKIKENEISLKILKIQYNGNNENGTSICAVRVASTSRTLTFFIIHKRFILSSCCDVYF